MSARLRVEIQDASADNWHPPDDRLRSWAEAAFLAGGGDQTELTIRIVEEDESSALNRRYRHRDRPTNVLSFPFEDPPGVHSGILGDVVICARSVIREAQEGGVPLDARWALMVVHGVLHLCGYDHENETDASVMEGLETRVLDGLGYPSPYCNEEIA